MPLKEILMADMKAAMINKDVIKKNTIQMTRASILQFEKDNKTVLDDDGVLEIIVKEVKKRKDALPEFEKSGRQDLIDNLLKEIATLTIYLPEQLSENEITEIVKQVILETNATTIRDMGKVMSAVLSKTKGRAEGKTINNIVKNYLS